jgi:hypothetical protein
VLHGLFTARGQTALWAEDSTRSTPAETATHPFAVAGDSLRERLGLTGEVGEVSTVSLLLPSTATTVMSSPELARDALVAEPKDGERLRLRSWVVPVVLLDADSALSWLDERGQSIEDCRLGASVHFLIAVARLARELVDRGRVLPAVVGEAARWRPALTGPDSARFNALQEAMPPICRAENVGQDHRGQDPAALLRSTVDYLVDALVRRRLATERLDLLPPRRGKVAAMSATTEAWLAALVGVAEFDAEPAQRRTLARQLAKWGDGGVHAGPVRTCFRLSSPDLRDVQTHQDEPDPAWRLDFLLQAADDPSVLVPAEQVWRADGGVLRRWIDRPQELLLTHLGQASRLYPGLDAALHGSQPVGLDLDTAGAHDFLMHAASLEQSGFGVLVPTWWQRPVELGLKLTTSGANTPRAGAAEATIELKALVDYRWELSLGEEKLTQRELTELAEAKVPLVRIRGQWVHADPKRLAAGLEFLRDNGQGRDSLGQVLHQIGLAPEEDGLPLPVTSVSGEGGLGKLLAGQVEQFLEPVEAPDGFTGVLRPYQRRGLAWLAFLGELGIGACLADDMGLGKTVQLLALEAVVRADTRRPPTLVICPMSVVDTWRREGARFAPKLKMRVHHGSTRAGEDELADAVAGNDLVITTYALAAKDATALSRIGWDRLVLDEAQNVKNSTTRQARAIRALPARHRVALTGTPVENRLAELWSIMDFLNPGLLGSANTFRARFTIPIERYGNEDAAARLRRITAPFILRRLKTDPAVISDLPEKIEMKQLCTLTVEQASLYQAVLDDMLEKIDRSGGIERKGLVLATMSRLKQVCNHPAQLLRDGSRLAGRSGKLARLEEILDEALAEGDKVLCFTQFAEFGSMLVPHLSARFDTEVLFLHGGTPKAARDAMVERFQSPGGPSIFLLSLKAGGTGLTLTAANQVVHLDRWWNPAVEDQATDRAFRIGQRRNVQVRKFVCLGTLEEKIDKMIEDKKALAQLVVGAGENWLTELSTARFRELVALSPEVLSPEVPAPEVLS